MMIIVESAKAEFWSRLLPATKHDLEVATELIMAKLSELGGVLDALSDQVTKVKLEVEKLKDSLTDVDLPAEATAALDRLTAAIKGVDDLNPDA